MKLREISLEDVRAGVNWKVSPKRENWTVDFLENEAELTPATGFTPSDQVVYSAVLARPSGRVTALLMFKQVGEAGYGGVYWEFDDGRWTRVGDEPDPKFEIGSTEFVANPLPIDPSFDAPDHDYRKHHRESFRQKSHALAWGSRQ